MRNKIHLFLLSIIAVLFLGAVPVYAGAPTDEITDYTITVDVNDDASCKIRYHIDWLVLESDGVGPVDWVEVGIPNKHCDYYLALSDNIDQIESNLSSSNSTLKIYFKDKYYEGETISFDFEVVQQNMYRVNKFEEGYTVYSFTPGWFNEIDVDSLTIKWNADKVESWSPECLVDDGYLTYNTYLSKGDKYTIDITYPNDAYAFDLTMTTDVDKTSGLEIIAGIFIMIIGIVLIVALFAAPFLIFGLIIYGISACFGEKSYKKEITRTKIEYFPACEGCGAPRKENEKFCTYCGRSMIKSETVVKESEVPDEIKKKTTKGVYKYSGSPDTYYSVNVVRVPVPRSSSSSSHRSSCVHSSCAHSSCAHSSCACACACACAGGGRAGCTNKDFYNTKLKMRHIVKAIRNK